MARQSLVALGRTISTAAESLDEFFDQETLELRFPGGKPTPEQGRAVSDALQAALQLQRMLLGPVGSLMSLAGNEYDLAVLQIIQNFSIAKHVPHEGTATFDDLSAATGIPALSLRRLLRHGMTNRIFREPTPNSVAHSVISRRLASDPMMQATVSMLVDEQFPASAHLSSALQKYGSSTKATHSAWALAHSAERPMVEELEARFPERAEQFSKFMKHSWALQNPLQPLIDNYDWAALGSGHVVDVGGSMGHASISLAKAFPNLHFTVQDFAKVADAGEHEFLQEEEEQLHQRVKFMVHDAFSEQPIHGADVYLLRSVLHDWPDDDCVQILRKLAPALKNGARVLINDYVMPDPGELNLLDERRARTLDLIMMSLFNAREREANEWAQLLAKADPRFRLEGVREPAINRTGIAGKKLLSLIEVRWVAQS